MSNDPIIHAVNNDPEYLTALADFFSKHSQTLMPFVDFEAGLSPAIQNGQNGEEAASK
ncbi:MAG: hypothetical protein KBC72_01955 [Acinetobacter sp.]|nr:hypothetical protein [Acinetobacter sp.]